MQLNGSASLYIFNAAGVMKNSILRNHFLKPVNMGIIDNPTHSSICKSDTCSDIVRMMVIIEKNERIEVAST